MADNPREDIVEIMRDAASELADGLHLRGLRNFAFEARFLGIVFQAQKNSGFTKPARARNGQRHRLFGAITQTDGHIARDSLPGGKPADGIGNRGFVFANDKVAGINRGRARRDPGGADKGLIEVKEPPIAVSQREAERKH